MYYFFRKNNFSFLALSVVSLAVLEPLPAAQAGLVRLRGGVAGLALHVRVVHYVLAAPG